MQFHIIFQTSLAAKKTSTKATKNLVECVSYMAWVFRRHFIFPLDMHILIVSLYICSYMLPFYLVS